MASGLRVEQGRRMMAQMVIDTAGDEVVAVVIARLQAQRQRMAGGLGRCALLFNGSLGCRETSDGNTIRTAAHIAEAQPVTELDAPLCSDDKRLDSMPVPDRCC